MKKEKIYNFINCGGITAIIAALVIMIAIFNAKLFNNEGIEFMDWTIFTSIVVAMVLEISSKILSRWLINKLEDDVKLTNDYKSLSRKYNNKQIVYDNTYADKENINKLKKLKKLEKDIELKVKIPVVCEYKLCGVNIKIDDCKDNYQLPDAVRERFDEIFAAHATSKLFNQLNIRMSGWMMEGNVFVMKTSRTTYFDSMVTNRAMDYRWKNGMSVRELYECGPCLNALDDSKLSNHIGFNGFVESKDGYVVFVKRNGHMSIGKRTYGNSLGASLKTRYALNEESFFDENGLKKGIIKEAQDELKIPKEQLEHFSLKKDLIAAYRDLVEGGKPQLLVVIRSKWTMKQIEDNFNRGNKKNNSDMLIDGDKLLWIERKDLKRICIESDVMIHKGVVYHMMPTATASVVMYIEYLKDEGLI